MSKKEMKAAKRIERESRKKEREEERRNAKTRRSKDGSWAVKNRKQYFWHNPHIGLCVKNYMLHNYAMTIASLHDSQIDLGIPSLVNYRCHEKSFSVHACMTVQA
jgi:IS5 family transposase